MDNKTKRYDRIQGELLAFILFAYAMFLVLPSCTQRDTVGQPLLTTCNYSQATQVNVVEYDVESGLIDAYNKLSPNNPLPTDIGSFEGFSTRNTATNVNTLHILKIRGQDDVKRIETLGHELMHTFCGDWHPKTISR
jgi:hypothetical protein